MWELDYKESWTPKNWCFWAVMLEKTLESPLDCKEIQPVHPKGNQSWIFIGRTDSEAETSILGSPDAKSWVIGIDLDARKDWGHEEKWTTDDEMVRRHHQLNGHEFEQTPRDSEGQGSLACCSPWCCKETDITEWLNNNNKAFKWRLRFSTQASWFSAKALCAPTLLHNVLYVLYVVQNTAHVQGTLMDLIRGTNMSEAWFLPP